MPVPPEQVDEIAATVADVYREAELAIVRLIARHLRGDLDRDMPAPEWAVRKLAAIQDLRRGARAVLAGMDADGGEAFRRATAQAYRSGAGAASAELPKAWFPRSGIGQAAARATFERLPGYGAVESLASAVHSDIGERSQNVLRDVLDAYRSVITAATARTVTGTATRREASQAAWRRLTDKGITSFTDRSGRRWQLSSYVEMAARTVTQRAAVQGQTDRLDQLDVELVMVSDHGQECVKCRPFEGTVLRVNPGRIGRLRLPHATRDGETVTVQVQATLAQARREGFQHPNCFPGEVLVSAPSGVLAADARRYEGPLVVIHTAGGNELSVTPNHPVLTPEGWVAAGQLKVGQDVLRHGVDVEGMPLGAPHDVEIPARIGEVFDALRQSSTMPAVRVPVSPEQFHGDGFGSDVDVVFADGLLWDRVRQQGSEGEFVVGGVRAGALLAEGAAFEVADGSGHATNGSVGGGGSRGARLCAHVRPLATLGLAPVGAVSAPEQGSADGRLGTVDARGDLGLGDAGQVHLDGAVDPGSGAPRGHPSVAEPSVERVTADSDGGRDLARWLAGQVSTDRVVEIEVRDFSGHVYNLQTGDGWYVAGGIVVHNCRHSVSAYLPGVSKLPERDTADPEGDKARQKQRALERKIRAAKVAEVGALTPEGKKAAGKDVRLAQAALREHLKANPKLKRLPYREQIGAGNIQPKDRNDPAGDIGRAVQPPLL